MRVRAAHEGASSARGSFSFLCCPVFFLHPIFWGFFLQRLIRILQKFNPGHQETWRSRRVFSWDGDRLQDSHRSNLLRRNLNQTEDILKDGLRVVPPFG